jgi:hypothetical protein
MENLMKSDNNYRIYRDALKKASLPKLPFMYVDNSPVPLENNILLSTLSPSVDTSAPGPDGL